MNDFTDEQLAELAEKLQPMLPKLKAQARLRRKQARDRAYWNRHKADINTRRRAKYENDKLLVGTEDNDGINDSDGEVS